MNIPAPAFAPMVDIFGSGIGIDALMQSEVGDNPLLKRCMDRLVADLTSDLDGVLSAFQSFVLGPPLNY